MRLFRICVLSGSLALSACTTVNTAVDASSKLGQSLFAPIHYVDPEYRERLKSLKRGADMGDAERAFVYDYIDRINRNYNDYITLLTSGKAATNITYDSVNLALTGGAAVAPGIGVKTGLAALSTFFQGQKQSIDKNIFNDQAVFALTSIMEVRRADVLRGLRANIEGGGKYNLGAALIDLDEFYRAGSLQNALQASFLNQAKGNATSGQATQVTPALPASTAPSVGNP